MGREEWIKGGREGGGKGGGGEGGGGEGGGGRRRVAEQPQGLANLLAASATGQQRTPEIEIFSRPRKGADGGETALALLNSPAGQPSTPGSPAPSPGLAIVHVGAGAVGDVAAEQAVQTVGAKVESKGSSQLANAVMDALGGQKKKRGLVGKRPAAASTADVQASKKAATAELSEKEGEEEEDEEDDDAAAEPITGPKAATGKGKDKSKKAVLKGKAVLKAKGPKFTPKNFTNPGVPKTFKPALEADLWKVYTDMTKSAWRCRHPSNKSDIACSWKVSPAAAWLKVLKVVNAKNYAAAQATVWAM